MILTNELIEDLARYAPQRRRTYMKAIAQIEFERCADDPLYWLDVSKHPAMPYVFTRDPQPLFVCRSCEGEGAIPMPFDRRNVHLEITHGLEDIASTKLKEYFKSIPTTRPWTLMEYMPPIVEAWLREPMFFVEKSRDMMMTWLFVALYTWDTAFHENRQNIIQSKNAASTLDLLKRAKFIYDSQPKFLRGLYPGTFAAGGSKSGMLAFETLSSELLGFPQGPDQIRGYHPTGIFVDEAAFQIEAGDAFRTIKPAIQMGGRYTAVSSANPGFFQICVEDRLTDTV